jgi:hypothetical protein
VVARDPTCAQREEKELMEINLFTWIRESVKHAVMQGVSDAVGHIGSAGEHDDMPQRLTEALRHEAAAVATATRTETATSPKPRRLGRSLDQLAGDKQ